MARTQTLHLVEGRPIYRIQLRGGGQGPVFDDGGGQGPQISKFPQNHKGPPLCENRDLRFRGGHGPPAPPPVYGPGRGVKPSKSLLQLRSHPKNFESPFPQNCITPSQLRNEAMSQNTILGCHEHLSVFALNYKAVNGTCYSRYWGGEGMAQGKGVARGGRNPGVAKSA